MTLRWRVLSTDLKSGEVGPDVPLDQGRWSQVAGRPDDFTGALPLRTCPPALLEGGRLVLHLGVGGLLVADAIVWDPRISRTGDTATVQLRGAGLASYWDRRRFRVDVDFDDVDDATIVQTLVDMTEADGHGIGIDTSQVVATGTTSDRIGEWTADDRPFVGRLITELQEQQDGPTVDVVVTRPDPAAAPVRTLQVRPAGAGATVAGALRLGEAIVGYDLQILGSQAANDWEVLGAGEGADMVVGRATDPTALTAWPQLDGAVARKTISKAKTANRHAAARLAQASRPPVPLTLELDPDRRPRPSAWRPGDILDVQLVDPPLRVAMPMRAVGRTWTIDQTGRLTVSAVCNPTVADRPALTVTPDVTVPSLRELVYDANDHDTYVDSNDDGPYYDAHVRVLTAAP